MTTQEVLRALRRETEEVDVATSDYTDIELLDFLADALRIMMVRGVTELSGLAISSDQTSVAFGFGATLPDDTQATLLIKRAAANILKQTYRGRVNRGELGITWQSGLESENSNEASRAYQLMIREIESEVDELLLIMRKNTFATRPQ
jgi:hypothetical protein